MQARTLIGFLLWTIGSYLSNREVPRKRGPKKKHPCFAEKNVFDTWWYSSWLLSLNFVLHEVEANEARSASFSCETRFHETIVNIGKFFPHPWATRYLHICFFGREEGGGVLLNNTRRVCIWAHLKNLYNDNKNKRKITIFTWSLSSWFVCLSDKWRNSWVIRKQWSIRWEITGKNKYKIWAISFNTGSST